MTSYPVRDPHKLGVLFVLLPIVVALFVGIVFFTRIPTTYIQYVLLVFLIFFCLSWVWNGWSEVSLLLEHEQYQTTHAQHGLIARWRRAYRKYLPIPSLLVSLLLMMLFLNMFKFSLNILVLVSIAAVYTVIDIVTWLLRQRQISRLSFKPGSQPIVDYYLHRPHIYRLLLQFLALLLILLSLYYLGDAVTGTSLLTPSYVVFLLCMICLEATIQCWRTDMKLRVLTTLGQNPPTLGLTRMIHIDRVFKACLYFLYIITMLIGLSWVASYITANFSDLFRTAYTFGGRMSVVLAVFTFAVLAYLMRLFYRLWYGICEAVIGLFVIYDSAPPQWTDGTPDTIKIAGGLFIIIRGLDNGHDSVAMRSWNSRITQFGRWKLLHLT